MKNANRILVISACALVVSIPGIQAQDWPQWRGPNRDAKASGFDAPKEWPKELSQKWKVTVGEGVATPSLAGDKLYVFSRQDGQEILRCLDAASGKELWQDKYDSLGASGPASSFSGPRSSPTVAEGKVVTLGVRGVLSCLDAESGKLLWRKDDFAGALPKFFVSSSPLVANGLCIAELGGDSSGGIVAYDLTSGAEKWRWTGDTPAYASPVLMTVDGAKLVVAQTNSKMVALAVADGKLQWEAPFAVEGRGYNAATPIVDGQTIIYTGSNRGITAVRLEKEGDGFAAKPLWKNADISAQFNSPVLKDKLVYGITGKNELFCLNAADGQTVWTAPVSPGQGAGAPPPNAPPAAPPGAVAQNPPPGPGRGFGGPGGGGGMRGRGMRGGGMRGGGYGSLVDAGSVILALTPASQLIAFSPGSTSYTELARIKVADSPTHAYPILSGKRIFTKDQDSVTLWTIE
ncbi:MAG TPA: PQQ-binding-like beta-propeller repeat protein [Chthoniobacter sp.]|jgi:outer membrane protein assembly factor BamB